MSKKSIDEIKALTLGVANTLQDAQCTTEEIVMIGGTLILAGVNHATTSNRVELVGVDDPDSGKRVTLVIESKVLAEVSE